MDVDESGHVGNTGIEAVLVNVLEAVRVPAMVALDPLGLEIRANEAFRRIVGVDPATAHGRVGFFEDGRRLEADEEPLARTLARGPMSAHHIGLERADGSLQPAIVSSVLLRSGDNHITGAVVIFHDEPVPVHSGEALRELSIHTPALLFTADPSGAFDWLNARWNAFIGAAENELLGSGWTRFVHHDDRARVVDEWHSHVASGEPYVSQWRFRRGDGTYRWTEIRAEAQRDAQGRIGRWFASGTDVDAQRRALESLDFLARTGATVAGAKDVPALLDRLAHASLEGLADMSIFDLREEDGSFSRLVVSSPRARRAAVQVTAAFETPLPGENHPIARAMLSGETVHIPAVDDAFIERTVEPAARREAWRFVDIRSLVCAPMLTPGGNVGALTLIRTGASVPFETSDVRVIEDVARRAAVAIENVRLKDRERGAARNLQAFADMGEALGQSLGLQKTLEATMQAIVPERADWAFINLVDERGDLQLSAVYHSDPVKSLALSVHVGDLYARGDGSDGAPAVVRTRTPLLVGKTDIESGAHGVSRRVLETFGTVGLTSVVILPLVAASIVRGTLHLCMESERVFAASDVDFFAELARRIAPAIANAELFERERRVARSFQDAALPASLPDVPGFVFRALYEAGQAESLVGGDWYDAFLLADGRIAVSIGDVAGSGLAAAVTMAGVRQAIRGAAHVRADPKLLLEAADRTVTAEGYPGFVTAFVGVIDPQEIATMTYQAAGHPPPILLGPDGSITMLFNQGPPLGLRMERKITNQSCELPSGSLLTLYTDGLIESTHDIFEGERRLRDALLTAEIREAENPAKAIHDAVLSDGSRDDVAILTIAMH